MDYGAKTALPRYAVERAFPKAFTTNGQKTSEAGKKRLSGDTARAATTDEVKDLRREARDLKEVVAEQTLELRILKKNMIEGGGDQE